ncbi:major facilitator superfamily domain-containing protein 8-like isoform X1 [Scyliorhinus canicula]|uniref:major facilitator superfamily domain-containing protein 8-like isoform X1 n=2 Tax=Scyliorhinus canicula TaxID=7830 RepID=UPI0018F53540|nr:major facilitator superfamily domain-containing protein 8-like isoform X1 [Scyliorhinus canicula]
MELRTKRRLTNITIGLLFLFSGIEYAVILPTIWAYLQTLDAEPYFLGLGLSAFSFSGLIASPIFGHVSDRLQRTKAIILFANLFEIAGNFMYFMGYSKWLLLGSRLVAGIGTGAGACIFGYLTRSTTTEERATVFAVVMAARQAGLLIGPGFNLFLRLCNFNLGPFKVNKYTSPGLFMCLMWIILQVIIIFMYYDLPLVCKHNSQRRLISAVEEEEPLVHDDDDVNYAAAENNRYGSINEDEKSRVPPTNEVDGENSTVDDYHYIPNGHIDEDCKTNDNPFHNFSATKEYLREEVVVVLTAQFITLFNQTALETMVTPITQKYFQFGELENSLMYCICGVEVIAGFFLVRWLSTRFTDRVILAVGLVMCNISCIWCLIFLANPKGSFAILLSEFVVGVFLQILGLPFVAVSQVSLFSKVTAEKTQGFSQGFRRSIGGLATILGPMWAGGLTNNLYVMLGVMMGLLTLLTIMMILSYSYLVEPPPTQISTVNRSMDDDC